MTRWIDVAAKLGAPVLRVFAGLEVPVGHTDRGARVGRRVPDVGRRPGRRARRDDRAAEPSRLREDGRRGAGAPPPCPVRVVRPECGYRQPEAGRSVRRDCEAGALRLHVAAQGAVVSPQSGREDRRGCRRPHHPGCRLPRDTCRSRRSGPATHARRCGAFSTKCAPRSLDSLSPPTHNPRVPRCSFPSASVRDTCVRAEAR